MLIDNFIILYAIRQRIGQSFSRFLFMGIDEFSICFVRFAKFQWVGGLRGKQSDSNWKDKVSYKPTPNAKRK